MDSAMQVKMGIAQLNSCVGDIKGNIQKAVSVIEQAKIDGVDIIVFPEMFVTGYPPNDILLCEEFVRDAYSSLLNYIVPVTDNICVIMGNIKIIDGHLRNCAVVIQNKEKKEDVIRELADYLVKNNIATKLIEAYVAAAEEAGEKVKGVVQAMIDDPSTIVSPLEGKAIKVEVAKNDEKLIEELNSTKEDEASDVGEVVEEGDEK